MIRIRLKKHLHAATGPLLLQPELEAQAGEFLAVTGPSGSGKTTLLRMIAGLETAAEGSISAFGETWLDTRQGINLRVQDRNVGLVFQDYALFPNMTVAQNLYYALPKGAPEDIISELVDITELQELMGRYPPRLSGGQQQRVALARALVRRPRLLLLDEPLSALDQRMRARLQNYILRLHKAFGLTTLIVSHDYQEIFKLADRVVRLDHGAISQPELPDEVALANAPDGSFLLSGEVLHIEEAGSSFLMSVLIGTNVVQVPAAIADLRGLQPGDRVEVRFEAHQAVLSR